MCDFKPGDEVVCIWPGPWRSKHGRLYGAWLVLTNRVPIKGATYTVSFVGPGEDGAVGVNLHECPAPKKPRPMLWSACSFRKVQRRDLSAWLATEKTIEEPKRRPVKERA